MLVIICSGAGESCFVGETNDPQLFECAVGLTCSAKLGRCVSTSASAEDQEASAPTKLSSSSRSPPVFVDIRASSKASVALSHKDAQLANNYVNDAQVCVT